MLARIGKGTHPFLNDALAPRLRRCGGRLQNRNEFVGSTKQPQRPKRTADTNQQHGHTLKIDYPSALPIEQGTLYTFPAALMPPATGVFYKPFLCGRQARYQIPNHWSMAVARQLVTTHVGPSVPTFPDPYLLEKAPVARTEAQAPECLPPTRSFNLRVGSGAKDIVPAQAIQADQKRFASMNSVGQHDNLRRGWQI